jgi:hypothetical protein
MLELGLGQPGVFPFTLSSEGEHGVSRPSAYASCSDEDLDASTRAALNLFPNFGRQMMTAYLKLLGLNVQVERVALSLQRVAVNRRFGEHHRISRRVYSVAGPNALWHIDAQLGEQRFSV